MQSALNPNLIFFSPEEYSFQVAKFIHSFLLKRKMASDNVSILLTGGKTAEKIYTEWAALPDFKALSRASFYFSDERCVPSGHLHSNYSLVMRTLFSNGIPKGCRVVRMEADSTDLTSAVQHYEEILPKKFDCILLTVGDDGHIASIFPYGQAAQEFKHRVMQVIGPNHPIARMTITPAFFNNLQPIFLFAAGKAKAEVLERSLQEDRANFNELPVRLVLNATWLIDSRLEAVSAK
jgi:6-phosphogluconolactonase